MFLLRTIQTIFQYFTATPEPVVRKIRIPPYLRNSVWTTYHQERDYGICYACGTTIARYNKGWHCSHVQAEVKDGPTTLDNLRTCCQHCNLSMGNQNLYAYIRDNQLTGPGSKQMHTYFRRHPDQRLDKRTNNWGRNSVVNQRPTGSGTRPRRPIITSTSPRASGMSPVDRSTNTPGVFDYLLSWLR